jgi:hypothetical protein
MMYHTQTTPEKNYEDRVPATRKSLRCIFLILCRVRVSVIAFDKTAQKILVPVLPR